jgi:formylglycine-generating enzyme
LSKVILKIFSFLLMVFAAFEFGHWLNYTQKGYLQFDLEPPEAIAIIEGNRYHSGNWYIFKIGEYDINMMAQGHNDTNLNIYIGQKDSVRCQIDLKALPGIINFEVTPDNATISIDNISYKSGNIELPAGTYAANIVCQGYDTMQLGFTLHRGDSICRKIDLSDRPATVLLMVEPEDASIYIEGFNYTSGKILLPAGRYVAEISHSGYQTKHESFSLEQGESAKREVQLQALPATINLTVEPSDAVVTINGVEYQSHQIELPAGSYIAEIGHSGYRTTHEYFSLRQGESVSLEVCLQALPGIINLQVEPSDATITINGKEYRSGQIEVPAGPYIAYIKCSGYNTIQEHFDIQNGDTINQIIMLERIENVPDQDFVFTEVNSETPDTVTESSETRDTVTDIDGNIYKTVKIGNQIWMLENLRVSRYRDGTRIPYINNTNQRTDNIKGALCWYDDQISNSELYGNLYNWYAVVDEHGLAPDGWNIPSDKDWKELETYVGAIATKKIEPDKDWITIHSSDTARLLAVSSGLRMIDGRFLNLDSNAYYWSSSILVDRLAIYRSIDIKNRVMRRNTSYKNYCMAVRCVKYTDEADSNETVISLLNNSSQLLKTVSTIYEESQNELLNIYEESQNKLLNIYEESQKKLLNVNMEMIFVKGGSIQIDTNDVDDENKSRDSVCISDFYMGKYEVSQGQYAKVMGHNPSFFKYLGGKVPVETVSWYDAVEFCNWLSLREGKTPAYMITDTSVTWDPKANGYRLPTEAEWEYAAGAFENQSRFSDRVKWAGTSIDSSLAGYAWYNWNSLNKPHEVGVKQPNDLGLYDMSGNVWEWCWDPFNNGASSKVFHFSSYESNRVIRGGSWANSAQTCMFDTRKDFNSFMKGNNIGFRLAFNSDISKTTKNIDDEKQDLEENRVK